MCNASHVQCTALPTSTLAQFEQVTKFRSTREICLNVRRNKPARLLDTGDLLVVAVAGWCGGCDGKV